MGAVRIKRLSTRQSNPELRLQRNDLASDKPVQDVQTGFLCHPRGFPLQARRKWFVWPSTFQGRGNGHIGIIFDSELYFRPGTVLELTIPVRESIEKFTGKVVLVRNRETHFQIGLWLDRGDDASRVRIVEQLCHIETYLKVKKYREGPYNLDPERVASEWITKYAGGVPVLQETCTGMRKSGSILH